MEIVYERDGVLTSMRFDATLREQHETAAIVSEHRVESSGGPTDFTDYRRPGRWQLTAEVFITDTPVREVDDATRASNVVVSYDLTSRALASGASERADARYSEVKVGGSAQVHAFPGAATRVRDVLERLRQLDEENTIVSVTGRDHVYPRLWITSISYPRTAEGSARVRIVFAEVHTASTSVGADPRDLRARRPRNRGDQSPEQESTPQRESIWHQLAGL